MDTWKLARSKKEEVMREIKFRGLCGKIWVYGYYIYRGGVLPGHFILNKTDEFVVDKKTVGQLIGT